MARYDEKFKKQVVQDYLAGVGGYRAPGAKYGIDQAVVRLWVDKSQMPLVGNMLKKALSRPEGKDAPLLHSDQGWQYQMPAWRRQLAAHGLTQSMSRKGNCLDNAAMESFFGTLKSECFYLNKFDSVQRLEDGLRQYIHYDNHDRIRSKLKGMSPVQYRTHPSVG